MQCFHLKFFVSWLIGASLILYHLSLAAENAGDVIRVAKPFARAVPPGITIGAAFMALRNDGNQTHQLVKVRSDAAEHVELHHHVEENGMMRMRQVAHIHLPPEKTTLLQPGGLHVMLIGLKQHLTEGDTIALELRFDDGTQTAVKVPVKSIAARQ